MKIAHCLFIACVAAECSAGLSIVGFSHTRGGTCSLGEGENMTQLRGLVQSAFSGCTINSLSTITAAGLGENSVAVLMAATNGTSAIPPLSTPEKSALRDWVLAGHGAVIFSDNESFAGSASAPANLSLLQPFGIACAGTGPGWERHTSVASPGASPVTSRPFGTVTSFSVGWSGWFTSTDGANVLSTLNDNGSPALLAFPRGALGPGSGAVVLFADTTMVFNGFLTNANRAVALNAIAFAAGVGCPGDLNLDGLVDDADFSIFVLAYDLLDCADPAMPAGCPADLNSDGVVDDSDFVIFVGAYDALLCP